MRSTCPDGLLPVFVLDRYAGLEPKLLQDFTDAERARVRRGERSRAARAAARRPRLREPRAAGRARSALRPARRFASRRTAPSSSTRCAAGRSSSAWGAEALARAEATYVGSEHIRDVLDDVVGHVEHVSRGAARRRHRRVRAAGPARALADLLAEARRDPPNPGNARSAARRRTTPTRLAAFLDGAEPTVVYFGKLIEQKGVQVLLEAMQRRRRAARRRRLRPVPRRPSRRPRRRARSSPARSSTATSSTCCRSPTRRSCRRSSPRRSAWSRPRPPPPARRRSSRATRASPRSPPGSRRSTRHGSATSPRSRAATRGDLARKLHRDARAAARRARRADARGPAGSRRPLVVGERRSAPARPGVGSRGYALPEWATNNASPGRSCSRRAVPISTAAPTSRSRSRRSSRSSIRDTLALTDRFEEIYAAALETDLAPNVVGELIASEVEVRTGRCENFGRGRGRDAGAAQPDPRPSRASCRSRSAAPARIRGAAGRTSASSTRRTTAATTRSSATSCGATTRSACTCTSGSPAPTARSPCTTRCATSCPSCSRSRRARRSSRSVNSGLHSARTEIFTRMFPRCGIPDAYRDWRGWEDYVAFLYRTGLDHRAHADLVERPAAPRLSDDRDPHRRRAARPGRSAVARGASVTRSPLAAPARSTKGSRCPTCRTGCSRRTCGVRSATACRASCSTSSAASPCTARARIEQLLEWVAPVADEIGAAPFLGGARAERRRAPDRAVRGGREPGGDLCRAGARWARLRGRPADG